MVTEPALGSPAQVNGELARRTRSCVTVALALGTAALAVSPAGGPSAALLAAALVGLAWWVTRGPAVTPASALSGNQALLLVLAVGGAAVLVVTGSGSRPLHGLAAAPFVMTAFALSSHNPRDLRTAVLAASTSLGVLSVADDRSWVMTACALGLVPAAFGWIAAREMLQLDQSPGTSASGPRPWGFWVVARLVLLTAVVALLMPSEPPPHRHGGSGGNPGDVEGGRGFAIAGGMGNLDLRDRQSLSSQPMLEVPSGSPQLWQSSWYDTYDGATWRMATDERVSGFSLTPLQPLSALPAGPGLTTSPVTLLTMLPLVYAPGPLIAVAGLNGATYDLGNGAVGVTGGGRPLTGYSVSWADEATGPVTTLSRERPAVSDPRWVALPAELPGRVGRLARTVTAGLSTTEGKVSAIATYLRTHEKYLLDSPVPAPGVDAVDAFLFTDHVGFCEQFASAETVLLRSLGIPARVATGFGGPGATGADGTRVYRNQDAHAWVQVGYPGGHWISSDPTAGSEKATAAKGGALDWLKRLWKTLTGTAAARRWLALGLVLTALVVWRLVLWLRRRHRASPDAEAAQARTSEAGRAYDRLLVRLLEQDRPRRPNETLRDLLARLRAAEAEQVARLLEREWYGDGRPPAAQEVAAAVAVLDGLALEPAFAGAP